MYKPRQYVLRDEASDGTTGSTGGGALDMHGAAAAFASLNLGGDADEPKTAAPAGPVAREGESPDDVAARLAAEDAAKDAPAEDKPATPEKFVIEVDGKPVELTAAEVAEHYKNGLRQQDYTKKTMEAAEVRKAADAEAQKAREQRDTYAQKLEHFAITANAEVGQIEARLTEDLLHSDPVEYLSLERTLRARQAELAKAQQEMQQINGLRQQEAEQAMRSHLQSQQEMLLAKVPEWKDEGKFKAEAAQIKTYLAEQGFTADESNFSDHRAVLLARKAMQFDSLMGRAKEAVKKVSTAPPKVERPGSGEVSNFDGRTKAMKKLSATGSISDAAAAFLQFT